MVVIFSFFKNLDSLQFIGLELYDDAQPFSPGNHVLLNNLPEESIGCGSDPTNNSCRNQIFLESFRLSSS